MKRKDLCTFILLYLAVVYVYSSLPGPLAQEKDKSWILFSHTWGRALYTEIRGVSARSMAATV